MKETWFVAYDPTTTLWDAKPIAPDYPDDCWLYKVFAKNGHEALKFGFDKHKILLAELSTPELRVAQSIVRQVNRVERNPGDVLMIDIPQKSLAGAQSLSERGFFTLAHQEEALIQISSAGWKAMSEHVEKQRKLEDECDFAQLG
jgi:hypothetical protein